MFAKALVILAIGATSTLAEVTELKTCAFVAKQSSGIAGTGKLIKDGDDYKIAITTTAASTASTKTYTSKLDTVPTTALTSADNTLVPSGTFDYTSAMSETKVALPGSTVTKDNIKHIITTGNNDIATGVCTFTDVSTSNASVLTVPVLAAAGLAMSLTL